MRVRVGLTARHLSDSAHMYIVRTCILMYNTHMHTSMVHLLDYGGGVFYRICYTCIFVCRCSAHEYSIHACTTLDCYMTLCMVLEFKDLHVVVYSGTFE